MSRSLAILIVLILLPLSSTYAQERAYTILSIELDGYVLHDGMLAFQQDGQLLLPMVELAEALDFYIDPDAGISQISGWVLDEDRAFVLDAEAGTITAVGATFPIPDTADLTDLAVSGEVYLPSETFTGIWPVEFVFQPRRLRLIIRSLEPLPLQLRLEREYDRRLAASLAASRAVQNLPNVTVPYHFASGGIAHVEAYFGFEDHLTANVSINAQHDFLWSAASWTYNNQVRSGDDQDTRVFHGVLERRADVAPLPFGIELLRAGDISTPADSNTIRSAYGRGVEIVSRGDTGDIFDRMDIEGTAATGWEAELYINQAFIDYRQVDQNGRYRFPDAPLQYGTNFIEVRFFGPHGEQITDRSVIEVPPQSARPGEFAWAVRGGETAPLFDLRGTADTEDPHSQWFQADFSYGVNELATLNSRFELVRTDETTYWLGSVGPGITAFDTYFRPHLLASHQGRLGAGLSLARNFENSQFLFDATFFNGLETPELGIGDEALRYRIEADVRANPLATRFRTILTANVLLEEEMDGDQLAAFVARQVSSFQAFNISNQFQWSEGGDGSSLTGRTVLGRRRNTSDFRVAVNYDFDKGNPISRVDASASWRSSNERWRATVGTAHAFSESESSLSATLSRHFQNFDLGLSADFSSSGDRQFGIRLSSTIGYTEREGLSMSSGNSTGVGIAQVAVFLDTNNDGLRDAGERVLPGVGVRVNGGIVRERTDANGRVILHDLSIRSRSAVTIDLRTLEDPMLLAGSEGVSLIARPGTIAHLELPVIETGLLDGILFRIDGVPVSGATIQLLGSNSVEIARTETAYDGYFVFETLPMGTYQVKALGTQSSIEVTVTSEEPFIFGLELQTSQSLTPRNLEAETAR